CDKKNVKYLMNNCYIDTTLKYFGCCSVAKSCLILCDQMDCITPGSSLSPSPGVCSNSCPLS
ncbi:unnamed protein product, partial [Rangifer tarandus platyrhynchus]